MKQLTEYNHVQHERPRILIALWWCAAVNV